MRLVKFAFVLICTAPVLAIMLAGIGWLWLQNEVARPGPALSDRVFEVAPGETLISVADRLEDTQHIRLAEAMRLAARLDGVSTAIKPGEYQLAARQSLKGILDQLVEGKAIQHRITLPEGLTTAQILDAIAKNGVLTGNLPDEEIAEGSLLPDTYFFQRGMTRRQLVGRMQAAQTELIDALWPARAEGLPLATRQDAIILASIVEKEAGSADEHALVAGVFTTRLKRGMRLQSDPTIIYGISKGEPLFNKKGQRRTLYQSEIDRKTDWNTYQIDGLPRTPIANPGRAALAAVLNPPETEFLFFVADGTGGHAFAETIAEHNRNVAAYRRIERARIAKERAGE